MGRISRNLLITVIAAVVSLGVGAWGGAQILKPPAHPASLHDFVHQELDLTSDQKARLADLERDFAARRRAREAELRAANVDLAAAMRAGQDYSPQMQAAIDRFHRTMALLQRETVQHMLDMRKALTPAQAARYDERINRALTEQRS